MPRSPLKVHLRHGLNPIFARSLVPGDRETDAPELREETDEELRTRIKKTFNYWPGVCGTWAYANMCVSRTVFEQIPEAAQCRRCRYLEKVTKSADETHSLSVEAMLIGLSRIWEPEIEPQKGLARIDWLAEKYE